MVVGIRATAIIGGAGFLVGILRGLDYVIPPAEAPAALSLVERAAPIWVWGWLWVVPSVLGLVFMWRGWYRLVALCNWSLCGLYLAFGVGALTDVLDREPIDGWRTAMGWILFSAVVQAVLADSATKEARMIPDAGDTSRTSQ